MRQVAITSILVLLPALGLAFTVPEDTIPSVRDDEGVCASIIDDEIFLQVSVDKESYLPGEEVQIDFLITNLSDSMIKLFFPTSQKYHISIYYDGEELWNSRDGTFTLPLFSLYNMASGESLAYHEVWPQLKKNDKPAKPGTYQVLAVFSSTPVLSPPPVSFRIVER